MKTVLLAFTALILTSMAMGQNSIELPPPVKTGGMPLMEALSKRATDRLMDPARSLDEQQLSNLLWAAWGINRPDGRRTAPSALNRQEIDIYLIGRRDAYRYDAAEHELVGVAEGDFRRDVNSQDYTKTCDWILVYVADYSKMAGGSDSDRAVTAGIDAGLIAQNVYLYGASEGLAVVVHMSINRDVIARALKLGASQHIVLAQSKIPDGKILLHAVFVYRFWNHYHASLHVPAQCHLRRGLTVFFTDGSEHRMGKDAVFSLCKRPPCLRYDSVFLH